MTTFGAALFAGGKSRRMGKDKAELRYEGKTFLHHVAEEMDGFTEKLLSVDDASRYASLSSWEHVEDPSENCGPLGGLCAVLKHCHSDALLVATCDLPRYRAELGSWLCEQLAEPYDAVVPMTEDGIHPLCAVYRKRCLEAFLQQLEAGDYRIRHALDTLRVNYVPAGEKAAMLANINTPEEYQALLAQKKEI